MLWSHTFSSLTYCNQKPITDHSKKYQLIIFSIQLGTLPTVVTWYRISLTPLLIFNEFITIPCSIKLFMRAYSKTNQRSLINGIKLIDLETVFVSSASVCTLFRSFYSKLSSSIDKPTPVKKPSRREIKLKEKALITNALRKLTYSSSNL